MSLLDAVSVNSEVPQYENRRQDLTNWAYWEASFKVDHNYLTSKNCNNEAVLYRNECETHGEYKQRQRITKARNYIKPIISKYSYSIFRNGIERTTDAAAYDVLLSDADAQGTSLNDLMKRVLNEVQIKGRSYVMPDSTIPADARTLTVAQLKSLNARPFIRHIHPESVINIRESEGYIIEAMVLFEGAGGPFVRWMDATDYCDIAVSIKGSRVVAESVSDIAPHGYSRIPLVAVKAPSQVAPLAEAQSQITNLLSLLSQELTEHTFTRHAIFGVKPRQVKDMNGNWIDEDIVMGSKRVLMFDEPTAKMESFGSEVGQADSLRKSIADEEMALYRIAGFTANNYNVSSSTSESGVSRLVALEDFYTFCKGLADALESAENSVMSLIAEIEAMDYRTVYYPDSFKAYNYEEELANLRDLLALNIPATIKRRAIADFVKLNWDLSDDEKNSLEQELNAYA